LTGLSNGAKRANSMPLLATRPGSAGIGSGCASKLTVGNRWSSTLSRSRSSWFCRSCQVTTPAVNAKRAFAPTCAPPNPTERMYSSGKFRMKSRKSSV